MSFDHNTQYNDALLKNTKMSLNPVTLPYFNEI